MEADTMDATAEMVQQEQPQEKPESEATLPVLWVKVTQTVLPDGTTEQRVDGNASILVTTMILSDGLQQVMKMIAEKRLVLATPRTGPKPGEIEQVKKPGLWKPGDPLEPRRE